MTKSFFYNIINAILVNAFITFTALYIIAITVYINFVLNFIIHVATDEVKEVQDKCL